MGVLNLARGAALAALLGGCYDPELPDCTIDCRDRHDCGPGQVCGDDGYCAAPAVAGTCREPAFATLRIRIERAGRVVVTEPAVTCESTGGSEICDVPLAGPGWVELHAVDTDQPFERWLTGNCAGQTELCQIPIMPPVTEVAVRFDNEG